MTGTWLAIIFGVIGFTGALVIRINEFELLDGEEPPIRDKKLGLFEASILATFAIPTLFAFGFQQHPLARTVFRRIHGHEGVLMAFDEPFVLQCFGIAICLIILLAFWTKKANTSVAAMVLGIFVFVSVTPVENFIRKETRNHSRRPAVSGSQTGNSKRIDLGLQENDVTAEDVEPEIQQLLDWVRLNDYQPTLEWHKALASFKRFGWVRLKKAAKQEPDMNRVLDEYVKHRHGIRDDFDSDQAWASLMSISEDASENGWYFSESMYAISGNYLAPSDAYRGTGRAVELLAPMLDQRQLTETLLHAIEEDKFAWPRVTTSGKTPFPIRIGTYGFGQSKLVSGSTALKPLVHAAWLLDRNLNATDPDQYNVFETDLGDELFRQNPPTHSRSALAYFGGKSQGTNGIAHLRNLLTGDFSSYLTHLQFRMPTFGSPLADEFLRREVESDGVRSFTRTLGNEHPVSQFAIETGLELPTGTTTAFGSIELEQSYHQLLFRNSPAGKSFRARNRDEILKLAIRSISPVLKKPASKRDQNLGQVLGALSSVIGQGRSSTTRWAIPQHLEFLFLDDKADESQESVAMEFWPYFDAMLDGTPKLHKGTALQIQWNYLARLWPESDEEMFVGAYLKSDSVVRQMTLVHSYDSNYGLPDTLPVSFRLKILNRIREEVAKAPVAKGVLRGIHLRERRITKNELETIKWALSELDCPEGAAAFLDLNDRTLVDIDPQRAVELSGESMGGQNVLLRILNQYFFLNYNMKLNFCDDRVDLLSRHHAPNFRRLAMAAIKIRPIPRHVKLLKQLVEDKDEEVRREAIELDQHFRFIRESELPRHQTTN